MDATKLSMDFVTLPKPAQEALENQLPVTIRAVLHGPSVTLSEAHVKNLTAHPLRGRFGLALIAPIDGLVDDIGKNGLQNPILVIADWIVDGERRFQACRQTGHVPTFRVLPPDAERYVEQLIISQNFARSHLSKGQLAMIGARICCAFETETANRSASHGGGLGKSAQRASLMLCSQVGGTQIKKAKKLLGTKHAQNVWAGKRTVDQSLRDYRTEVAKKRAILEAAADPPKAGVIKVLHGDFRQILASEPAESVNLILTDPPYNRAYLPLWGELAALADRVLQPGGLMVAMSGKEFLPQVFAQISKHPILQWEWEWNAIFDGATSSHPARGFFSRSRPILIYSKSGPGVKRKRLLGAGGQDVVITHGVDKSYHPYGQKVEIYEYLVNRFSKPGDLVMDPFGGGGTIAKACVNLGRNCITTEIDGKYYRTIHERIFGCLPSEKLTVACGES